MTETEKNRLDQGAEDVLAPRQFVISMINSLAEEGKAGAEILEAIESHVLGHAPKERRLIFFRNLPFSGEVL